jgi:hypothetical protein
VNGKFHTYVEFLTHTHNPKKMAWFVFVVYLYYFVNVGFFAFVLLMLYLA